MATVFYFFPHRLLTSPFNTLSSPKASSRASGTQTLSTSDGRNWQNRFRENQKKSRRYTWLEDFYSTFISLFCSQGRGAPCADTLLTTLLFSSFITFSFQLRFAFPFPKPRFLLLCLFPLFSSCFDTKKKKKKNKQKENFVMK